MMLEFIFASLLAPVRMLIHTRFVLSSLFGRGVHWGRQQRAARVTTWRVALRVHAVGTLLAIAWGVLIYALHPEFLWWMLPVLGALVIAIPLAVYTSSVQSGRLALRAGLFITPEENKVPAEIAALEIAEKVSRRHAVRAASGFSAAIVDPYVNAVVMARLPPMPRRYTEELTITRELYRARLMARGANSIDQSEKLAVLHDRELLGQLHERVWSLPPDKAVNWPLGEFT